MMVFSITTTLTTTIAVVVTVTTVVAVLYSFKISISLPSTSDGFKYPLLYRYTGLNGNLLLSSQLTQIKVHKALQDCDYRVTEEIFSTNNSKTRRFYTHLRLTKVFF